VVLAPDRVVREVVVAALAARRADPVAAAAALGGGPLLAVVFPARRLTATDLRDQWLAHHQLTYLTD